MARHPNTAEHFAADSAGMVRWDYTDLAQGMDPDRARAGTSRTAQQLVGAMFSTAKELRHLAEQHFGELFVPVRVLVEGPFAAVIELRVPGHGDLLVHGERDRHWYPFRVAIVEQRAGKD